MEIWRWIRRLFGRGRRRVNWEAWENSQYGDPRYADRDYVLGKLQSIDVGGEPNDKRRVIFSMDGEDPVVEIYAMPFGVSAEPCSMNLEHGIRFTFHDGSGPSWMRDAEAQESCLQYILDWMKEVAY